MFQPYAKFWLPPLAQLVVAGHLGREGMNYFLVDVMVTMLSWSTTAVLEVSCWVHICTVGVGWHTCIIYLSVSILYNFHAGYTVHLYRTENIRYIRMYVCMYVCMYVDRVVHVFVPFSLMSVSNNHFQL